MKYDADNASLPLPRTEQQLAMAGTPAVSSSSDANVLAVDTNRPLVKKPPQRKIWHGLWRLVRLAAVTYLAVILMLMWMETSLIYPAPQYPRGDWQAAETYGWEDVNFVSADGTKLHGWYRDLTQHGQEPQAYLLYCHGNGENVAYLGEYLADMADRQRLSIFAFDYRGYGRSEGSPHEAGILADGEAAQQWLAKRANIPANQIVLMGRSLGGGVAVDLAARNGARGLIVQSTFTSLPDAAARMYPWAPVRWLMRNRYNSLDKIKAYHGPLLQSHGNQDTLVPIDLGQQLHAAAPGTKEFFVCPGGGHNDLEPPAYQAVLARFLASLPK
ncbi:Putative aminoacrylate hydrolase RutD [Anatilimnocola aggregata]|uniref:Aminoacrylate hydrolase RutD n=1 Tax=Anatilimnocola aggregata TaxID=2528021 RepID=A0A517Y8D4_9BACT|nr:alpha/beta hydrolase [Anatilimnocola aggregata]QDU26500.1 Putative aminoacrylate hydrolase RutD [Anatilimnocola aggregata]